MVEFWSYFFIGLVSGLVIGGLYLLLRGTKETIIYPSQEANSKSKQVREWLEERDDNWHGFVFSLNCWHKNNTEYLFLYEDRIVYTENLKKNSGRQYPIPNNKKALYNILSNGK